MDLWEGPLFVSKMNGFRYLSLLGDEVAILFDGRNEIMINLNNFAGQISGLCGDADGNRRNDRGAARGADAKTFLRVAVVRYCQRARSYKQSLLLFL